jgi:putative salt-induced outer membrane protein YdiY
VDSVASKVDGARRCLPDAADAEGVELGVDADDGNIESESLSGDHAVPWITMDAGEAACKQRDFGLQRQNFKPGTRYALNKVLRQEFSLWQLALAYLVRDLVSRDNGHEKAVAVIPY